jgi:signal transduction histidine kinase
MDADQAAVQPARPARVTPLVVTVAGVPRPHSRPVLIAGALLGLGLAVVVAVGGTGPADAWSVVRGVSVATYVLLGAYIGMRRPGSRLGFGLVLAGWIYAAAAMTVSSDAGVHTAGRLALAVFIPVLATIALCFPYEHLMASAERRLLVAFALASAVLWTLAVVFSATLPPAGPLTDCVDHCPPNALQVVDAGDRVSSLISTAVTLVSAAALVGFAVLLARKAGVTRLRRRFIEPVLWAFCLLGVNYAAYTLVREVWSGELLPLRVLGAITALSVPVGMFAGQVRGQIYAARRFGQVVSRSAEQVTPVDAELVLRDTLGDPLLSLLLYDAAQDGYVDVAGAPAGLPADTPGVAVTRIDRGGRPVAALVHDAVLADQTEISYGLAAAMLALVENTQLVEELRASRSRIVTAASRERLRLERDLHDGAQQRLLAIQMELQRTRADTRDPATQRALRDITDHVQAASGELVALAHGLYATVLRERGLPDALRAELGSAALPVTIVDDGIGRLDAAVEEAVYFCVLEAVQNAAKHAGTGALVDVTLSPRGDDVAFTIADDGRGFDPARCAPGTGLVSIRDRVGAVGGEVAVSSAPGVGTRVTGLVPRHGPATADGEGDA